MPLKVEYLSIMAQAQKIVGISGIERFAGFVNGVAAVNPAVLDKVDVDQMIDVYGDMTSVPPGIVRPDEDVEAIRQDRAQQQQAAASAEMMSGGAKAAKDLSETDMTKDSALTTLMKDANAGNIAPAA